MFTLSKKENEALNQIIDRIMENAKHGISSYHVIKKLFEYVPELVLETDYSNVESKLKQMYTGAIKLASREIDQKILAVAGQSDIANRFAEAYSRIKKYIIEKLYDLIVQTYDFKMILGENTFHNFLKSKLINEASLDMSKFVPNTDKRLIKSLGTSQNQANNFKFIIHTIMKNMNNVFNNSIKTVKNQELKQKIQKINTDIVGKTSNFINLNLAPTMMPNFLDYTNSKVSEYKKDNEDDKQRKEEDDDIRTIQLLDRILIHVGLPNSEKLVENTLNAKNPAEIQNQIIEKFKKSKFDQHTLQFIVKALEQSIQYLQKNSEAFSNYAASKYGKKITYQLLRYAAFFAVVGAVMFGINEYINVMIEQGQALINQNYSNQELLEQLEAMQNTKFVHWFPNLTGVFGILSIASAVKAAFEIGKENKLAADKLNKLFGLISKNQEQVKQQSADAEKKENFIMKIINWFSKKEKNQPPTNPNAANIVNPSQSQIVTNPQQNDNLEKMKNYYKNRGKFFA